MTFHYIILSWAVVGIADSDVRHSLQAMRHGGEPIEDAVERYVTGYLSFWRLAFIDRNRHLVLTSPHPSPLSAHRGFFGNHHFSRANAYLVEHGKQPIVW